MGDFVGCWVVDRWPGYNQDFYGRVVEYDDETGYRVLFDDGDVHDYTYDEIASRLADAYAGPPRLSFPAHQLRHKATGCRHVPQSKAAAATAVGFVLREGTGVRRAGGSSDCGGLVPLPGTQCK